MRILTFVTQKGGTAKSTLAASIAFAAEEQGQRVHLLDLDPQGTLRNWRSRREAEAPAVDHVDAAEHRGPRGIPHHGAEHHSPQPTVRVRP